MSFFNPKKPPVEQSTPSRIQTQADSSPPPNPIDKNLNQRTEGAAGPALKEVGEKFSELPFIKAVERIWTVFKSSVEGFFSQVAAFFNEKFFNESKAEDKNDLSQSLSYEKLALINEQFKPLDNELAVVNEEFSDNTSYYENLTEGQLQQLQEELKAVNQKIEEMGAAELARIASDDITPPDPLVNYVRFGKEILCRNACYRNSVNQMLEIPFFKRRILDKLEQSSQSETTFQEAFISGSLFNLWFDRHNPSSEDLNTRFYNDEKLLAVMAGSGRMPALTEDLYMQQDASEYMTALFDDLGYGIKLHETLQRGDGESTLKARKISSFILPVADSIEQAFSDYLEETFLAGREVCTRNINIDSSEPLEVIPFQINRKIYENGGFGYTKEAMDIPEILDLSALYKRQESPYELQGFVYHQWGGVMADGENTGHYIAYVKRGDCWYECDDTKISLVNPESSYFQERKNESVLGVYVKIPENLL